MNVCLHYVKAALNDFLDLLKHIAQAGSSSDTLSFFLSSQHEHVNKYSGETYYAVELCLISSKCSFVKIWQY